MSDTVPPASDPVRKAFEDWYAVNAFDYVTNPIGSRECGLQWKSWQAALASQAPAAIAEPAQNVEAWLDRNTTFYNTNESTVPVLASVSKRIWYHATDDTESYPFSAVIDAARKAGTP